MPAGIIRPNSEIQPIVGIQFGIFSPDEIERRSVVEITNAGTYDGNEPRIGGLFDPRMGVLDNGKTCRSCSQTNHSCPGHFGHFKLARPVYFIQFFGTILNVLNCVCVRCSKLLIDKELHADISRRRGEGRWRAVLNKSSTISRCGQETEDGCGARQPDRYVREGIARIVAEWDEMEGPGATKIAGEASSKQRQYLEVEFVLRLFRRITDEDVDFIGLNRFWCRPDWMICSVMPIPPPQVRPSVIQDNNQRSEDDLTHKLFEIIMTNQRLQDKINNNSGKNLIEDEHTVLQYHVATLVDNQIPGVAPSAQRSGRPLKSVQQRLGSKEGRIRYNIQGKRVEFSARSVITPDPRISIGELGVPIKIAMNLTFPEKVTPYNRDVMYKLVQNGADKYPGAKTIVRAKGGRMISLKHINTKEIVLHLGDVVNRHLADGDIVLFNRQPTLHRMSMMGHRVRVLPYNTFRLNVSVTSPYNADFDGDEMNAHIPQSYEASCELSEIAAVPHQIVTPRHAKPVIGVVQDSLVGSYRMTQPTVNFNRRAFMNMMMWNRRFEGVVPKGGKDVGGKLRWTGHQVISQLLPPINIEMGNGMYKDDKKVENLVKIREGVIQQGILDKDIFSKPAKGIVHVIFKDHGSKETVDFIDAMQNTVEQFLVYNGFSVGISDLIADEDTRKQMEEVIKKRKAAIENILLQIHMDLFDNNTGKSNQQEFEDKVFGELNKATEEAGKIGLGSLADENRLVAMVRAGSKGSTINIAQMMACVGQQAPEGRRIPYGFTDRTLPHYKKYDDGAEARGFVENSFIDGLSPQEFFFHAMSGREGLIDTAVKSVTGDTKIVIIENGNAKCVAIGDWIDAQLDVNGAHSEYFPAENNLEMLQLKSETYIPTVTPNGTVSWGKVAAVTRHDPGQMLYEIKTLGGRLVIVPESKSLLVWRAATETFEQMNTPDVRPGHCMPVTMSLPDAPVVCEYISLSRYLPKSTYLYGTDFLTAQTLVGEAMLDREHIPAGWWNENNGTKFQLPYDSKARFVRTLSRSKTDNILKGYVYPFTTNRDHARISEEFTFNADNGRFLGLFLAEGNVDVKGGYVGITNNNPNICQFVHDWFEQQRIHTSESVMLNAIGGVTTTVRGYSTVLAKFFDVLVGHGAAHKRVPAEAFCAPIPFITGLLDGYFSGDGTVTNTSIEAGSASKELIDGITMLCSRIGIFAKMFESQMKSNNLGTETILPTYRLSIRAQWATRFAEMVTCIDDAKQNKLNTLKATSIHKNFPFQNDVVLDEIVEINKVAVDAYPKLYDLTVPETFTFGLANGLQVYDTADTGYIQRQLVKAMEDLVTQYDGSVRDSRMNIVQMHYGEDGTNATKIESASLGLQKLSEEELLKQYGMLDSSGLSSDDTTALDTFAREVLSDRKMLVEGVQMSRMDVPLFSPVNLERVINTIAVSFELNAETPTELTPAYIIEKINSLIKRTQPFNKLWGALLRFNLAPHKMLGKARFTQRAFDALCEMILIRNYQSWALPGEQVGIIAAQSIGEPSTQMTLNSVDWDTQIMIAKNGKIVSHMIGEFIDSYIASVPSHKIQYLPNDQIYVALDDGNDWKAISCDTHGKMMWTKLEAITSHPVVNTDGSNTILEVSLASGRVVKATKGKSFLTRVGNSVEDINGSELKLGDVLPIATSLAIDTLGTLDSVSLREILPPSQWLYGSEVEKALTALNSNERHWFQKHNGTLFTVPYARSDAFRDAFVDGRNSNASQIKCGYVYPSRTRPDVSQIPENIPLTEMFGFFVGAYVAEGMSNSTQVCITNNDSVYLEKVQSFMKSWNVGTHIVSANREAEKSGIKGLTTSLIIHSTAVATIMQKMFGRVSYEKTLPDWVFQAPDTFIKGLVDGYISGDGTIEKKTGCVKATSVSKDLLVRLSTVLARSGIFTTLSERTPELGVFDSVRTNYTMYIPVKYSNIFASIFTLTSTSKQNILDTSFPEGKVSNCRRETTGDMVWDTIKAIREVVPIKNRVYDLTVESTRNFMTLDCIGVKDTFHLAGVAAKSNVTRGVPRLKELLKVTQNPKAISLSISLKPEFRGSKEKARQVAQDLELTLLKDITIKTAVYFDPSDSESTIEEDRELLAFYKLFEAEAEGNEGAEEAPTQTWSGWLLRLEMDRDRMFRKNISMDDVAYVLRTRFGEALHLVYSDYNSNKLIMRMRLPEMMKSGLDDLVALKKFQSRIINGIVFRGIPGIKSVTFREDKDLLELEGGAYKQVTQYVLDTDGSNFLQVMNHPYVDATRISSSHVHDIYPVLGIEATRAVLINEITTLFEEAGVNNRHLGLLCDVMTRAGRLMPADRHGINKTDIGPLAKASFEETEKILLNAALFGEMDPVTGVSSNIMMGQPIRGGTGFFDILLDESALLKFQDGLPDVEDSDDEDAEPTTEQINQELFEDESDLCSTARLRMNVAMPNAAVLLEEPDVGFTVVDAQD
jgi:DNA-directed RNA polymerase beta' subunit